MDCRSYLLLPALLWLGSCSEAAAPRPHIDFSDWLVPLEEPDATGGGESDLGLLTGDKATGDQGQLPTDGGAVDGDSQQLEELAGDEGGGEEPDVVIVGPCKPGIVSCHEGAVVRCRPDGEGFELLDDCDDGDKCTQDECLNGMCVHTPVAWSCCSPPCPVGELCVDSVCHCVSNCMGKECGDDGCGGSCGECPGGAECSLKGKCKCTPDCTDKACGDDSCGGSCGVCLGQSLCLDFQCLCQPDCTGKVCGDDGCGGSCGGCPELHKCIDGACQIFCPVCPQPPGCELAVFGSHAYYRCPGSLKWGEARDFCKDNKSHLVTISSAEENGFVAGFAANASFWIGYYQEWYTWEWSWVNGEGKAFESWGSEQPDNGGFWPPDEDCVEIGPSGYWNDLECGAKLSWICEFEP